MWDVKYYLEELQTEIESQLAEIILGLDNYIIKNYDVLFPTLRVSHSMFGGDVLEFKIVNNVKLMPREVERDDSDVLKIKLMAKEILEKRTNAIEGDDN